jgi:hypothetical protein
VTPSDMASYLREAREELLASKYIWKRLASIDGERPCNPAAPDRPPYLSMQGAIIRVGKTLAERAEVMEFLHHHGLHFNRSEPYTKQMALDILERAIRVCLRIAESERAAA